MSNVTDSTGNWSYFIRLTRLELAVNGVISPFVIVLTVVTSDSATRHYLELPVVTCGTTADRLLSPAVPAVGQSCDEQVLPNYL